MAKSKTKRAKKQRNRDRRRARQEAVRERFEEDERTNQPVYDRPVKVTDESFGFLVLESDVPVVVDFWASWCAPCRTLAPSLERLAEEMAGEVRVAKYNTEKNKQMAGTLGVRSLPTLILFRDGKVADKIVGAVPYNRLKSWVEGNTGQRRSLLDRLTGK
jgi:thioredoxin 1